RLRAHSEVALAKTDEEETARALQTVIQQSEALIRILEAIMSIAQVEAGSREDWQQVDVVGICADIIEFYEPLAEEQSIELTARFSDEAVSVTGSEQLLTQAIGNLVDNAIKYTPPGSDIRLVESRGNGRVDIDVIDSGPGIPRSQRDKAVQRFVRLDNSRSEPGNGLGLAMVAAIARQHGGDLQLRDARPGARMPGLRVRLQLPLS